jgi:hypothetical protein
MEGVSTSTLVTSAVRGRLEQAANATTTAQADRIFIRTTKV